MHWIIFAHLLSSSPPSFCSSKSEHSPFRSWNFPMIHPSNSDLLRSFRVTSPNKKAAQKISEKRTQHFKLHWVAILPWRTWGHGSWIEIQKQSEIAGFFWVVVVVSSNYVLFSPLLRGNDPIWPTLFKWVGKHAFFLRACLPIVDITHRPVGLRGWFIAFE